MTLSLGGRTVVRAERFRVAALLRERTGAPPPLPKAHGLSGRVRRRLADPVMWRAVCCLLLLVVIGIPGFVAVLLWAGGIMALLQPIWHLLGTSAVYVNGTPVHSLAADTVTVLAGLLTLILLPRAVRGIAGLNRAMGRRLLAPRAQPRQFAQRRQGVAADHAARAGSQRGQFGDQAGSRAG